MLRIGSIEIDNKICSAPMAGFTDLPYRHLAREFGSGLCWSELIMARGVVENNKKTIELLETNPQDRPLVVQLGGAEPDIIAQAAKIAENRGADIIDINCGCPVPKMVKRGYGAGLMKTPDIVGKIVEEVKKNISIPVTVKMRAGFNKSYTTCVEVAQIAQSAGASALTVHGRYRDEFFRGVSDWEFIKIVKSAVSIPVIGNGDIHGAHDAARMMELTGCDAVMIGRATLGNPWIFREISTGEKHNPSPYELLETIDKHTQMLCAQYGEKSGFFRLRSILCHYTRGLRNIRQLRTEIIKIESTQTYKNIMDKLTDILSLSENIQTEHADYLDKQSQFLTHKTDNQTC